MWRSARLSSTLRATPCWAWAAASRPTPIPTGSGMSACTRRHRSLIAPTAVNEYLGQPFRLADHQVVARVHLDDGPHAAERLDAAALRLDGQRAVTRREDPRPRYVVGHIAPRDVLHWQM